jgi:uncharacterized protein YybS (DUF2232 family)
MPSDESKIFLWGGTAVAGSGLFWILPGINALAAVIAIAAMVVIVSRLGYMRAFWAALGGLIIVVAMSYLWGWGTMLLAGAGEEPTMQSALFSSVIFNTSIFALAVLAPGIAMGAASRGLSSAAKTVWYGFIPILVLFAVLASAYITLLRHMPTVITEFTSGFSMLYDQHPAFAKMLMQQMGDAGTKEQLLGLMGTGLALFIKLIPGTIVIGFMALVTISLALAGIIGSRLKLMIPRLRPFYLWHASEWWLLPTAIGLGLFIFGGRDLWRFAGGNILIVTGNVYAVTGLALVESYFRRLSIPVPLRVAFYVIIFIMSFTFVSLIFLAILGLIDSRFAFRRENPDKEDIEES